MSDDLERVKVPYDAWLQWTLFEGCNLSCEYCSGRQNLAKISQDKLTRFSQFFYFGWKKFFPSPKNNAVDVDRLMAALDHSGKTYFIGLTGGEPSLHPDFARLCRKLTEKHYIVFTSNFTAGAPLADVAASVDPGRVEEIVASLHIKELEKRGLVDRYVDNFLLFKNRGFKIRAAVVAYPPLAGEIAGYRRYFSRRGVDFLCVPFSGFWQGNLYPESYSAGELDLFGLDRSVKTLYHRRGQACNAGYNVCVISPRGAATPCYLLLNRQGNIYHKINFRKKMTVCSALRCGCPLKDYNEPLFAQAMREESRR